MSGFLTNGLFNLVTTLDGNAEAPFDTGNAAGQNPESGALSLLQIAIACNYLIQNLAAGKTMVAGTRYYGSFRIDQPQLLTGIAILVGGTGGTDLWTAELFNSAGVLVATTDFATGTTAGTAAVWQKIAFGTLATPAAVQVAAGNYFISLQSNGTTAKFAAYNAVTAPAGMLTGSQTGTFTTQAAISSPSTTYTANLAPVATVY